MDALRTAIEEKVATIIATPQQFMDFQRRLSRSSVGINNFHKAFGKLFERMPNPFVASEQQLPNSYRNYYLTYLMQALRYRDFLSFVQTHDASISVEDFASLVSHGVLG